MDYAQSWQDFSDIIFIKYVDFSGTVTQ